VAKPEPVKQVPAKVEPPKVEPKKVEPSKVEPAKVEALKVEAPKKVDKPIEDLQPMKIASNKNKSKPFFSGAH
jgi:hypothetical protein